MMEASGLIWADSIQACRMASNSRLLIVFTALSTPSLVLIFIAIALDSVGLNKPMPVAWHTYAIFLAHPSVYHSTVSAGCS